MGRHILYAITGFAVLGAGIVEARDSGRRSERVAARQARDGITTRTPHQTIAYGSDPLQQLDFYHAARRRWSSMFMVAGGSAAARKQLPAAMLRRISQASAITTPRSITASCRKQQWSSRARTLQRR